MKPFYIREMARTKEFVDPVLEAKDYKWKALFRGGKEVGETARSYAQARLKSLSAK